MKPPYQLTSHPVGSLKEIFSVSFPLILGLLSTGLMLLADRLFLSHYTLESMNASVTGGMAAFILIIFPQVVASMSEVFVGRLNGSGEKNKIGKSVWQFIWFCLASGPYFWVMSRYLAPYLFMGSPLIDMEGAYFIISSDFSIFWCMTTALMGFYIGIGRPYIAMISTILGNIFNVIFDYLLIFGVGPFPEMGIKGAALGTGLATLLQAAILCYGFIGKKHRLQYGTGNFEFNLAGFIEGIRIGVPAGLGRFMEASAHLVFLRAISFSGLENMTIVAIIQTIYIITAFCTEGLSKAVAAIVANLIGAKEIQLIGKVLRAATIQHFALFIVISVSLYLFSEEIIKIFLSSEQETLIKNPHFMSAMVYALTWMTLYFLFDGFSWILIGQLLAAQDTKFLMIASTVLNWSLYVLPVVIGVAYFHWGAKEAWVVLGISSMINFLVLLFRYRTGAWLQSISETEI